MADKKEKKSSKTMSETQEIDTFNYEESYDNTVGTIFSADSDAETGNTKAAQKSQKQAKTKNPNSNKKTIIIVVAVIIVLAALIGVYFLVQNIVPDSDDPTVTTYPTDENGEQYATDLKGNKIESQKDQNGNILTAGIEELVSHVPADIKSVEVTNENGTFVINAETPTEVTTENGTESTVTSETVYTLKGYEDAPLAPGKADAVANDAASVTTTNIVDIKGENPEDYGLDKPRATVNVVFNNKNTAKIIIGNDAPDNAGAYIKVNDDKAIYLVDSEAVDSFLYKPMAFLDTTITDAAGEDENSTPNSATISGSNFKDTLKFEANDDVTVSTAHYKMLEPIKGFANVTNSSAVLGSLRSVSATKVLEYKPDTAKLKKYGIDTESPYAELTAKFDKTTIHLYAAKPVVKTEGEGDEATQSSETYIYNPDKKMLYSIATSSVGWVTTSYEDMVFEYAIKADMPYIKNIEVTAKDKTYKYDISTKTSTDSEGNETRTTTTKCGDKTIEQNKFDIFFQNLESAEVKNVKTKNVDGNADLTVKITYTDDANKEADTYTFYKGENGKYNYSYDGKTITGEVFATYVNKIIEDAPKIAKGEEVTSL